LRLPDASLREGVDGLSVGGGSVWVTESGSGVLHRVDVRSGATRSSDLGQYSTPPVFGLGWIWVCSVGTEEDSAMLRVDPRSLRSSFSRNALPAEDGRFAVGFGSLWRHDLPSGSIMRFDTRSGDPVGIVPVLRPPTGGLTVTSIAAGAGGVWATIGRDG
jgi:streptogramin lyase